MQLLLHIFPRPFDFRLPRLILDNFHFFFGLVWFESLSYRVSSEFFPTDSRKYFQFSRIFKYLRIERIYNLLPRNR